MLQVAAKTLMGLCLVLAASPTDGASPPGDETPIARARRLIKAGDRAAAVTVLEDALIDGPSGERRATLELLRQSYEAMAREAESAGRTDEAAHHRDNLAILERARQSAGSEPPAAVAVAIAEVPKARPSTATARTGPARPGRDTPQAKTPATRAVPKAAQALGGPVKSAPAVAPPSPAASDISEPSRPDEAPGSSGPPVLESPRPDPSLGEPIALPEPAKVPQTGASPTAPVVPAPIAAPRPEPPLAAAPATPAADPSAMAPPPGVLPPSDFESPGAAEMQVNPGAAAGDQPPATTTTPRRPGDNEAPSAAPRTLPSLPGPALAASRAGAGEADEADRLFQAERYEQAGRVYAELAARNELSPQRRPHWAYCRMRAVVRRINAPPRSSREWDEIENEIRSIQRLAPGMWAGDYLLSKVGEMRRSRRKPLPTGPNAVVRGSAPDEPAPQPASPAASPSPGAFAAPPSGRRRLFGRSQPPAPPAGQSGSPESAPAPGSDQPLSLPGDLSRAGDQARASSTPRAAQGDDPPSPSGRIGWQVHETASFRIYHRDPELAERAATVAEATRSAQCKRWGSPAAGSAWSPRCELYLYPDGRSYAEATGQPEASPGISSMANNGERVLSRRMSLRADNPRLLTATLPHEVTHIVMADLFVARMIPRWADEGIAVLAEPASEQHRRQADLKGPLDGGRVFDLGRLMSMDYPEPKDWRLFYAQSVSLTRYLVDQGPPERFIQFVRDSQRLGAEAALRDVYQIDSLAALQERLGGICPKSRLREPGDGPGWRGEGRRGPPRLTASSQSCVSLAITRWTSWVLKDMTGSSCATASGPWRTSQPRVDRLEAAGPGGLGGQEKAEAMAEAGRPARRRRRSGSSGPRGRGRPGRPAPWQDGRRRPASGPAQRVNSRSSRIVGIRADAAAQGPEGGQVPQGVEAADGVADQRRAGRRHLSRRGLHGERLERRRIGPSPARVAHDRANQPIEPRRAGR